MLVGSWRGGREGGRVDREREREGEGGGGRRYEGGVEEGGEVREEGTTQYVEH